MQARRSAPSRWGPAGAGRFSRDCGADKRADGMARCPGHQCRNACCRRGVALMFCPGGKEKPLRTFRKRGEEKEKEAPIWRNCNLSLALPVAGLPFITTGFSSTARLVQEKGWELSWVAVWFIAHAITCAVSLLSFGPLIDRLSPRRLLPWFLMPQAHGHAGAMAQQRSVGDAFYLIMTGVSSAICLNACHRALGTAVWSGAAGRGSARRLRQGR